MTARTWSLVRGAFACALLVASAATVSATTALPAGQTGAGHLVVHRIVGTQPDGGFVMRGDHNSYTDVWHPRATDVVGRFWVRLPGVAGLAAHLAEPFWFAAAVGLMALVALGAPGWRRPRRPADREDPPPDEVRPGRVGRTMRWWSPGPSTPT
ncbi:MAG: S24/S26 family peptidase [Actinomycetes bacterium]